MYLDLFKSICLKHPIAITGIIILFLSGLAVIIYSIIDFVKEYLRTKDNFTILCIILLFTVLIWFISKSIIIVYCYGT